MKVGEPLEIPNAFQVLYEAYQGHLKEEIPLRIRASPIQPSVTCFYVVDPKHFENAQGAFDHDALKRRKFDFGLDEGFFNLEEKVKRHLNLETDESIREQSILRAARYKTSHGEETDLISIKYQGFNGKNTEFWWSREHNYSLGVAVRAMAKVPRKTRAKDADSDDGAQKRHGFAGRQFTLIGRDSDGQPPIQGASYKASKHKLTNDQVKQMIVRKVPSLVQFWNEIEFFQQEYKFEQDLDRTALFPMPRNYLAATKTENYYYPGLAENDNDQLFFTEDFLPPLTAAEIKSEDLEISLIPATKPILEFAYDENTDVIEGDLVVDRNASFGNLHIKGDLIVEGDIHGSLVTETGKADYAEWFGFLTLYDSKYIEPGAVVQLRSPEQKITLDTSHPDLGPLLVISTSPSIAAGKPHDSDDGAFCAFMGQVPIKVRGPINCGDLLFPTGSNNGVATSRSNLGSFLGYQKLSIDNEEDIAINEQNISDFYEPVGTAMESCGSGEHVILSFVRWQHNSRSQTMRENEKSFSHQAGNMWIVRLFSIIDLLFSFWFYFSQQGFYIPKSFAVIEVAILAYSYSVFPNYVNFVKRGDCLGYMMYRVLQISYHSYCLSYLLQSLDDNESTDSPLMVLLLSNSLASAGLFLSTINLAQTWMVTYPDQTSRTVLLFFNAVNRLLDPSEPLTMRFTTKSPTPRRTAEKEAV